MQTLPSQPTSVQVTSARAAVKREDGLIEFQTGLHRGHDGDTPLTHLVLSECAPIAVSLQPPIAGATCRTTFPAWRHKPQGGVFWRFVAAGEFDSKMFQLALCGSKGKMLSEVLIFRPTAHIRAHAHTTYASPRLRRSHQKQHYKSADPHARRMGHPREPPFCRHTRAIHVAVHPCHICTRTCAGPCHICTGTGLTPWHFCTGSAPTPAASAPGLG